MLPAEATPDLTAFEMKLSFGAIEMWSVRCVEEEGMMMGMAVTERHSNGALVGSGEASITGCTP